MLNVWGELLGSLLITGVGLRYKSHRLEAGCISKTICKLNTWCFRGSVVEVLDSHNVKTWHG